MDIFDPDALMAFFQGLAYQPMKVYLILIGLMTASSFGLPVPEEVTLVSVGLVAYLGMNPDPAHPPPPGAESVDLTTLAIVAFLAVLLSDVLIYLLGRFFGKKLLASKFFDRHIGQARFDKVQGWFDKYGHWTPGLFRFTPGVRFPGHMSCGMLGVPLWKFLAVDGTAALISVPTQVVLVALYGEVVLENIKEFKIWFFSILGLLIVFFVARKIIRNRKAKAAAAAEGAAEETTAAATLPAETETSKSSETT
ncbi:MAG: DedA family protein [Bradymonadia bacterium]